MNKEIWNVRNLVGSSKENDTVLDCLASPGPIRVFFKEDEEPSYASKSLISVNNCQLCENGCDSILYNDVTAPHSLTCCVYFYGFFTEVKLMEEVSLVPQTKLPC